MRSLVLLALSLAACQREPVGSAGAAGECAVTDGVRALLGRPATDALLSEARRLSGAKTVRRIAPDTMVTMDYHTDRLNVQVDDRNVVTGSRCG